MSKAWKSLIIPEANGAGFDTYVDEPSHPSPISGTRVAPSTSIGGTFLEEVCPRMCPPSNLDASPSSLASLVFAVGTNSLTAALGTVILKRCHEGMRRV